ncbi:lytic transglycosylase domain-containing protein [Massilia sp. MB5]|uniref:lytic transglycosylase domain-containing protein n=1 Tax=unclassified Massilia TaxID=2609279 RepID=UPI00067E1407|nr:MULTISPECIES: lytic transglycosylase domain-containing protein [unclassified Massilia]AKU22892.1 invasion protein [Massilia sp. NR 4-1]UMR32280.1 lytic transglycosylase domain-containing protein [Massilia sp. MB5]
MDKAVLSHAVKRHAASLAAVLSLLCLPAQACWEEAASWYRINPYLLYAIAKTESGLNPAAINRNKNGSYDIGLMQINSSWLPTLRKHGLEEKDLYDACISIQVGAWILSQNMQRMGVTWEAVGAYNARNPALRTKYAMKVHRNLPKAVLAAQGAGYDDAQ